MQTGIYTHYKGGEFLVFCQGNYEENVEPVVIYQHLSDDYRVWVRLTSAFEEEVDMKEYNYRGPRFTFVRPWSPEEAAKHPKAFAFPSFETRT